MSAMISLMGTFTSFEMKQGLIKGCVLLDLNLGSL